MSDHYQYEETRELVGLVEDATELVRSKGEAAFGDFRVAGSRWRQEETYIFVLDPKGNMLVHPDPGMEGKNELDLKDVNGKPIIRGLIDAAMTLPGKPEGWYHYQWPVLGGLLPRWKSSYVRLVTAPSGNRYVVGSGMYNDRMERTFVVDAVKDAVGQIEKNGTAAFTLFHDPTGPFIAKDAYIFVFDMKGIDLVNPGFPSLEGRNLLDLKDTQGKQLIREMFEVVQTRDSGWVDYMWPKPGESVSTQKSAYVSKAKMGDQWVLVGCGVYLADAPKAAPVGKKMTAPELMALVRDGAAVFEKHGEKAYPELRQQGSKWFRDDTYFFVWAMDGTRVFHAANPVGEGQRVRGMKDILGRPIGEMILDAGGSPSGEGWIHYMYPEPEDIFPTWKSTFVKRVTFPSGQQHIVGCGIYNMQMDRAFIEDVVSRAATLVAEQGKDAFGQLRDRAGPFVFMDTYVFVTSPDGTELVNPVFPSLEGKNLIDLKDLKGKPAIRDEIAAAMKEGSAWLDLYWYKPGQNTPACKQTFVRKAQFGQD
ncbi:MAG: cache domain-containing protein, partial [Thiobacillus sp.]|nr:cache domain-containing protein [Thiobacillus sp.]